jgi:hypothetical protein
MLSNHKSTARVNLLSTCCNFTISVGFHSSYRFRFLGRLYFNLNIHSCNTCGKSQKNTSCKSLNTYLSKYLRGLNFGFLLSFYTDSSSFIFNQLLISAFVGFHGLNNPFYILILLTSCHQIFTNLQQISFTQSLSIPTKNGTICLVIGYSCYHSWADPGSVPSLVSNNTLLKTIDPLGKPEGKTMHMMHCIVSPEIVLMGGCNTHILATWE